MSLNAAEQPILRGSSMRQAVTSFAKRYLPQGGTLSEERWWKRHRGVLALLWVHSLVVPIYALIRGLPLLHVVGESLVLPIAAAVASMGSLPRRARTLAASTGLLTASGVLVHLSGGLIEMHFHFFVMVAVVSLYQDWIPFLAAIGYVLVHHGLVGALDPDSVYNHPAAINSPWKWAGIHAFFIAGISTASLVAWRLNETLLGERRRAETQLREESRVTGTLNEIAQIVIADLALPHVLQRVIDAAVERTSAQFGAFFYNVSDDSGESYFLHVLSGAPPDAFAGYPMPRNTEIFAPTFTGTGVVRLDDVTRDPRYAKNPPFHGIPEGHLPVRSYLAVPVKSRGVVIGGLFFGHSEPGRFTEVDERIAVGVASHASVAIENSKLFEAEAAARSQAEHARRRLAIIAEASRVLSASLDLDAVLQNLAGLVVPSIGDDCTIDFAEDDGSVRRVFLAIESRAAEAIARLPAPPPDPSSDDHPSIRAIRTGESILLEDVTPEAVAQLIERKDYHQVVSDLGPRSAAVVPIVGPERVLGALTLATTAASERRLGPDDLALLEEMARRTATAIENARRYEEQRDAAQTLQRSLLPERLPQLPAIELAARYSPGKQGTEVGGDWYDVIQILDGRVGLAMGDVVGRGLSAASLMGQMRNALRAYAHRDPDPGTVLTDLNSLFSGWGAAGNMATVLYGVFDVETGELRLASAGHPPIVIRKPDGTTSALEELRGLPLGAVAGARYTSQSVVLEDGDTALFYTDGLVEDRRTAFDDGLDRLRRVAAGPLNDLDSFCSRVIGGVIAGREADDDLAMLALRYLPLGDNIHLTVPTDPWVLKPLRGALRRWLNEAGATEEETVQLVVAASEACSNVIRHAAGSNVRHFRIDGDRNGKINLGVTNVGRWRGASTRTFGGRGLKLIAEFVDDLSITEGPPETIVRMSRSLANAGTTRS